MESAMKATIKNKTNSPFELARGTILPAFGEITVDFSNEYLEVLKMSLAVEVVSPSVRQETPVEKPESDIRAEYKALTGKDADGRWKDERVEAEVAKLKAE